MLHAEFKVWRSLNWPNRISIMRLLLVAPFFILLMNQQDWSWARHAALGIFAIMGFSDYLDGMLARRLGVRTRLGAILDPLADKVLIMSSVVLLSLAGSSVPGAKVPNYVVVAIVGKDLWEIVGFLVVYLVTDRFRVHPTRAGKACTAGQLLMLGFTLLAPDINCLSEGLGTRLALYLAWMAGGLSVLAAVSYTRLGLHFVAKEQKPYEEHNHQNAPHNDPH